MLRVGDQVRLACPKRRGAWAGRAGASVGTIVAVEPDEVWEGVVMYQVSGLSSVLTGWFETSLERVLPREVNLEDYL